MWLNHSLKGELGHLLPLYFPADGKKGTVVDQNTRHGTWMCVPLSKWVRDPQLDMEYPQTYHGFIWLIYGL